MYRPRHYKIHELVPRTIYLEYEVRGKLDLLWLLFDNRILMAADILRDAFGAMIINDWFWGGQYDESGWRFSHTTTGAKLSQHKSGRALDLKPKYGNVNHIREKIVDRQICNGLITCVEDRPWLHIDCRIPDGGGRVKVIR